MTNYWSYRVEIVWKDRTPTGQTVHNRDIVDSSVEKLRRDPRVLEVRVHTYETRTERVREEVFPTLVGETK